MKTAIFSIGVFLISLFLGSCQPSETSCSVVDTGKTLDYKIGDKLLFSYNYTTVYPAPGVDSVYKRSGFIHPLKTLGGEVMTNCSPADHYHHFGLWYAWTKTTFEGNEIDFWNLHKKQGTVRFRNFEHVSDNGFVATLDHVVYPDSPAEKVAMNERLKINIGTTSLPGYYIDYHTTIRLASPSSITMKLTVMAAYASVRAKTGTIRQPKCSPRKAFPATKLTVREPVGATTKGKPETKRPVS